MTLRSVVILGAPRSGKSWLARALNSTLQASGVQNHWFISESPEPTLLRSPEAIRLLMGLDLPGLGPEQDDEDKRLRQALVIAQTPFTVIYGKGVDRLSNALLALDLACETDAAGLERESAQFNINRGRDAWQCNDCSDPACEHKLFTRLLAQRAV
jgi:ribosome-interacting GTPase 1